MASKNSEFDKNGILKADVNLFCILERRFSDRNVRALGPTRRLRFAKTKTNKGGFLLVVGSEISAYICLFLLYYIIVVVFANELNLYIAILS